MSGDAPELVPRGLEARGGLTADLLTGIPAAVELLPVRGPAEAAAHLPPETGTGPARLPLEVLRGVSGEEHRRLTRILGGDGVLVTTGQQPVLFLGPLLLLYKAVTAVTIAGALRERGVRAAPLFWVAGDDHDWGEVGATSVLDTENRLRTLRLEPDPERQGRAVGPSPLPTRVTDLVDLLMESLPASDFAPGYLELLRDAWRPGRAVGEAFGLSLEQLLDSVGIPWLDSTDTRLRGAARPLYRRVLAERETSREALERATRRVRNAGYEPQVRLEEGALPLFVDRPTGRSRLYDEGADRLRVGREGEVVAAAEILEELEAHPERFSPDVALRPVLASWLLPTAATVLGPSELAYWAQLPDLFEWAGAPFPELHARDAWTVIEDKVGKVLEKLGTDVGSFEDGGREIARRVRESGTPDDVESALGSARRSVAASMEEVEDAIGRELPGIRSAVGAARHGMFEVLDDLRRAVDGRVEERHEVVLRQIEKAALHLFPDGRPQERVLSPLYYLTRYGDAFLEAVLEASREARSGGSSPVAGPDTAR